MVMCGQDYRGKEFCSQNDRCFICISIITGAHRIVDNQDCLQRLVLAAIPSPYVIGIGLRYKQIIAHVHSFQ